jgi:hypothetical protein
MMLGAARLKLDFGNGGHLALDCHVIPPCPAANNVRGIPAPSIAKHAQSMTRCFLKFQTPPIGNTIFLQGLKSCF